MADPTSSPSFFLDEAVYDYVISHTTPVDDVQHSLMDATAKLGPVANMQIAPDMGMFLSMLVSAIRPSFAVEVGTFTGYSSLAIARALPEGADACSAATSPKSGRPWPAATGPWRGSTTASTS